MARTVRSSLVPVRIALRWELLGVLAIACMASASESPRQIYVVNTKPPSVSIVGPDGLKLVGDIPLAGDPSYAVTDRQGRFVYVVLQGQYNFRRERPTAPSQLAILNMGSRKLLRKIQLGWYADPCSFVRNQRYLLCFSRGFLGIMDKPKAEDVASVKVIDAETNETTVTLSAAGPAQQMVFTRDASKIFVLLEENLSLKTFLVVFSPENPRPLAEIELASSPSQMALSADEKWLYLLDEGNPAKKSKRNRNGVVYVVDVPALKVVASHDVGTAPRGLVVNSRNQTAIILAQRDAKNRIGQVYQLRGADLTVLGDIGREALFTRNLKDQPGTYLFSFEEMRFLPDEGPIAPSFVELNRKKKGSAPGPDSELNGYPWELVYLPTQKKAALSIWPTSNVAFVNLKENKVERVVTTGRKSVKVGKTMGAMAFAAAMGAGGWPAYFSPLYPRPNPQLETAPDGRFVYALNVFSGDITIINSEDYSVIDRIPAGGVHELLDAPGGKFICAFGAKQILLINTQTNKVQADYKLVKESFNKLYVDMPSRRIFAMTTHSLLVWDTDQGKLVTTIEGFAEPYLVLDPGGDSPPGD